VVVHLVGIARPQAARRYLHGRHTSTTTTTTKTISKISSKPHPVVLDGPNLRKDLPEDTPEARGGGALDAFGLAHGLVSVVEFLSHNGAAGLFDQSFQQPGALSS
jgi:hypothetical protein